MCLLSRLDAEIIVRARLVADVLDALDMSCMQCQMDEPRAAGCSTACRSLWQQLG